MTCPGPGDTAALGDIAEFIRGITFKPDDVVPSGTSGSVRCMRTKNVQAEIDLSDVWSVDSRFVKRANQYLQTGDLLVSSANSWNLVGKCCWVPEEARGSTFGGFISALRSNRKRVDPKYLYHWFSSDQIQTTVRSFGRQTTNISNLDFKRCLSLPIPLPSLDRQRWAAQVLDSVDALRARRREAIALLDDLAKSIFFDMFGEPASNLRGMHMRTLGDIVKVKSGSFLPAVAMNPMGKYPVYGGNGINGFHDEYLFDSPRIVLGRVGVYCGCVHLSRAHSWVTDNALYISEIDDSVDLIYLYHALQHANLNQYASKSAQPLISGSRIYGTKIIVPPSSLQRDLSVRVNGVGSLKREHEAHLAELDALFACLQHRAFRGELWDSPAA